MTDASQSSGWWLASDGKWYAPELHPDAQSVASEDPLPFLPPVSFGNVSQTPGVPMDAQGFPGYAEASRGGTGSATFYADTQGASPSRRSQKTRVGRYPSPVVLLVLAVVVGGGALAYVLMKGSGSSIAQESPDQIVSAATAAVRSSGSVHVVTVAPIHGVPVTWVGDVGATSGEQAVNAGAIQAKALVVNGTTYFNANQEAMTQLMGVSAAVAAQADGKWLSLSPSDPASSQVADTLTVNTLLPQITPQSPRINLGLSTVDGQQVVGITGKLQGGLSATLYVSATGQPFPVEMVAGSGNYNTTTTFSAWGEAVHPSPPSNAIPASTLGL